MKGYSLSDVLQVLLVTSSSQADHWIVPEVLLVTSSSQADHWIVPEVLLVTSSSQPDRWIVPGVLLVTSSSQPDHWIVPGGGVEPEEEPRNTAIREVEEEAGVLGKLGRCSK
ncbi:hypothetical protein J6590_065055 [Homalodisca vitripennis]|nr:hypothetical protein J6590_065055 [Homalodisca vitripennis]